MTAYFSSFSDVHMTAEVWDPQFQRLETQKWVLLPPSISHQLWHPWEDSPCPSPTALITPGTLCASLLAWCYAQNSVVFGIWHPWWGQVYFHWLWSQLEKTIVCYVHVCVLNCSVVSTLCDFIDCSPPGSCVHGVVISPYWSGLPFLPTGDLPDPGIEPMSAAPLADGSFTT